MVRLFRVILPVSDIEKAASIYAFIFDMPGKRVSSGRHYFDCGGTILACFDPKADGDPFTLGPNPDHVYFSVSNLDEMYEKVAKTGCRLDGEIDIRPWGERSFYAKDPFGNRICFVDDLTVFLG